MSVVTPQVEDAGQPPPFRVRPFTVAEYHKLGDAGVLTEADRVELLEGWIVPKMNRKPPHDAVIELVQQALSPLLPTGWRIRIQSAITTDDSEPEPDLAVVRGAVRDHIGRHPTPGETELVVEVADASVSPDRWKCRLYARAGIPQYWIVNLVANRLEVYGDPTGAVDEPNYGSQREYGAGDVVSLGWGDRQFGEIQVRDLLP